MQSFVFASGVYTKLIWRNMFRTGKQTCSTPYGGVLGCKHIRRSAHSSFCVRVSSLNFPNV